MPYLGNPPAERFTSFDYQDLTGGSGTSFTLDNAVGNPQEIEVFVNNVRQEPGVAYTVSGTALTMTGSIATTDDFYVVFQGKAIQTATHPSDRALTATDGTFTGDASVTGDLTVDTSTLKVDAVNNRVGVGTTSPGANVEIKSSGLAELRIDGGAVAASVGPIIRGQHNNTDAFYIGTNSVVLGESSNQDVIIYGADSSSGNIRFYSGASSERVRFDTSGIAKFRSANNIGRIMTLSNTAIADDSSVTLTNATAGAVIAMIYDGSSGDGASVFFTYSGQPSILSNPGGQFATSDTDGKFCVIKSSGAHNVTFKNRIGSTRSFNIFLIGGDVRP